MINTKVMAVENMYNCLHCLRLINGLGALPSQFKQFDFLRGYIESTILKLGQSLAPV